MLITTPQTTALNDTIKSLSFTKKLSLPVLGLVENMAGYVCPCCGEISDTFGRGGGEHMAAQNNIAFLGRVPIDTALVGLLDAASKGEIPAGEGVHSTEAEEGSFPLLERYLATTSSKVWKGIAENVVKGIEKRLESRSDERRA